MMRRRSFLLLASGASLLSPRIGGLHQLLDPPQGRGNDRIAGTLCRGGPIRPASASVPSQRMALPGSDIPKFSEPLATFAGSRVSAASIAVSVEEFQQFVLPAGLYSGFHAPFNQGTYVWGYRVGNAPPRYPGFTIEAQRGTPTTVSYLNNLPLQPQLQQYLAIDQTLHWADPLNEMGSFSPYSGPPPIVTHLHGGEVSSEFDGNPEGWFTPGQAQTGPGFSTNVYNYPNAQQATTLWFHDHALGMTRINVYAGLAAFYLIRDAYDTGLAETGLNLPSGTYEVELAIQDHQFDTNGQLFFPAGETAGLNGTPPNPEAHPFWIPEFFGDVIVVNGKTWPYLSVEPRRYRLRILNACNARFLDLKIARSSFDRAGPAIWQIGTDGGLLDQPVALSGREKRRAGSLLLAPAERADVIIDFADFANETLLLLNTANAPYPSGDPPDAMTNGQVMQFRVNLPRQGQDTSFDPAAPWASLRGGRTQPPAIVRLTNPDRGTIARGVTISRRRQLTLIEVEGDGGPLEVLVNNTKWDGKRENSGTPIPGFKPDGRGNWVSELPQIGSTELWEIVNLTEDAHPMHVHLVQFQLLNRQKIRDEQYLNVYSAAFPGGSFIPGYGPPRDYNTPNSDFAVGGNPAVSPFLQGLWTPPEPGEEGWKDTIRAFPGQVTRLVIRWAPVDAPVQDAKPGANLYPFDPAVGPGYVWHCHILDHEDNDMMRPYSPTW
jgi:FtsP/CotA-like multicopper oxidase with cupredoxin domain